MVSCTPKEQKETQSWASFHGSPGLIDKIKSDEAKNMSVLASHELMRTAELKSLRTYQAVLQQEKIMEELWKESQHVDKKENVKGKGEKLYECEDREQKKQDELNENKLRQQICRDSPELALLREKIAQAERRKEIARQIEYKEKEKLEQKRQDKVYRDQISADVEKLIQQTEAEERFAVKCKEEYKKALEQQLQAEEDVKNEEKCRKCLENEKIRQEMKEIQMEDENEIRKKKEKNVSFRKEMKQELDSYWERKQLEKHLKHDELAEVESQMEKKRKYNQEVERERQEKQRLLKQRQDLAAQFLQEKMQKKETKEDLTDGITRMREQISLEMGQLQEDVEDMEKRLKQAINCSEMNVQLEEVLNSKIKTNKDKHSDKSEGEDILEKWCWWTKEEEQAKENLRKQRELDANHLAIIVNKEEMRKQQKRGVAEERKYDARAEEIEKLKQKIIEEEMQRLHIAQKELEAQN